MRPAAGVLVELLGLTILLSVSALIPEGVAFGIYVIAAELLATYLVHCPAHYIVGTMVGIRFQRMRLGRTTLARALPPRLSPLARLLPVLTLSTDKDTLRGVAKRKVALMYWAGTVASVSAALAIAFAATPQELPTYAALAWLVALGYLAFDVAFSPKSGDLSRACAALA
jgi:hypothetical protein